MAEDGGAEVAHRGLAGRRHQHHVHVGERRVDEHDGEEERRRARGAAPSPPAARGGRRARPRDVGVFRITASRPVFTIQAGSQLEREHREHEQDRRGDLRAVGGHERPQPREETPVDGLAERLLLEDRLDAAPRAAAVPFPRKWR